MKQPKHKFYHWKKLLNSKISKLKSYRLRLWCTGRNWNKLQEIVLGTQERDLGWLMDTRILRYWALSMPVQTHRDVWRLKKIRIQYRTSICRITSAKHLGSWVLRVQSLLGWERVESWHSRNIWGSITMTKNLILQPRNEKHRVTQVYHRLIRPVSISKDRAKTALDEALQVHSRQWAAWTSHWIRLDLVRPQESRHMVRMEQVQQFFNPIHKIPCLQMKTPNKVIQLSQPKSKHQFPETTYWIVNPDKSQKV